MFEEWMINLKNNEFFYKVKEQLKNLRAFFLENRLSFLVKKNRRKNNGIKNNVCNVLFVLQYPEMWNSFKSVYEAMLLDDTFSPIVLAVPKQNGVNSSNISFQDNNDALVFCKRNNIKCKNARIGNKWINIKKHLHPNYIFVQRPYDECMPSCYSLFKLSKIALLCYIPYGYEFVRGVHLKIEYNYKMLSNLYFEFAESQETKSYVLNLSKKEFADGIRKVEYLGYPRFDLIDINFKKQNKIRTFLWLPRWSISDLNDKSHFFDYFDFLLNFFDSYKELQLIIRPHPLMFKNFIEKGVLTKKQVKEYIDRIGKSDNVSLDEEPDYLDSFYKSDALIADFTSLLIEYFLMNKPIIYCGDTQNFNNVGSIMSDGFLYAGNSKTLENNIMELYDKGNYLFDENKPRIDLIKGYPNSGIKIKDAVLNDFTIS